MKAALNPFAPGSGRRPPALVGRDAELDALDELVERTTLGRSGRGIVLHGLRGVGKTVLLNEMRARAEDADWFVVSLEARPGGAGEAGVRQILAREIAAQARQLRPLAEGAKRIKAALGAITSFNAKFGATGIELGVEAAVGRGDSGNIEIDLPEVIRDLSTALGDIGRVFGVFIDELQDLDKELLRALLVAQHDAGQRDLPFYVIGAGLPNLPSRLAETQSYAERLFDYRTMSQLPSAEARAALAEPVGPEVSFAPDALDLLVDASGGYPYFLQEYGRAAWDVSAGPTITHADAEASVDLGLERLDQGFFSSRWDRATPAERLFLAAMAEDADGPSLTSQVARRLGRNIASLGPTRANLIAKGLVYAPEHGKVAYTVPGMAAYVHRHREDAGA